MIKKEYSSIANIVFNYGGSHRLIDYLVTCWTLDYGYCHFISLILSTKFSASASKSPCETSFTKVSTAGSTISSRPPSNHKRVPRCWILVAIAQTADSSLPRALTHSFKLSIISRLGFLSGVGLRPV